jgi:tripartite-type tricarboxylate transporter receptor subunit TctC
MRSLFRTVAFLALALVSGFLAAQPYPYKPIRIILGFPPGGAVDVVGRILAQKLTESFGQQVIVDNRAGANGIIGADIAAKAAPDGYTILLGTTSNFTINPLLNTSLPFSFDRDFTPLTQVTSVPFLLFAHPSVAASTLGEFIAFAKANPGKVNYYSSGIGSLPHLAGELLNSLAGIKTVHVAYKGTAPGLNDLLAGQVQFGFDAATPGIQYVKPGRLKVIATTGQKRLPFLPDIASANETLPGLEVVNWHGMMVPAGTPRAVISRLHAEIVKAMNIPDIREKLIALGTDPVGSSPGEFGAFMKSEALKWARVIKNANIHLD